MSTTTEQQKLGASESNQALDASLDQQLVGLTRGTTSTIESPYPFSDFDPTYILREDGSFLLREDGTYFVREG